VRIVVHEHGLARGIVRPGRTGPQLDGLARGEPESIAVARAPSTKILPVAIWRLATDHGTPGLRLHKCRERRAGLVDGPCHARAG